MCQYVAYYRVSTDRQGRSGLGLDAQHDAVRAFLDGKGWPPVRANARDQSPQGGAQARDKHLSL
jgi:DNA invertase Pin-like site-specific DNA recombinase